VNGVVLTRPLDVISRQARPYPADLLEDCSTGLVLFAAAYLGHNDAIHFARKQLTTVCVDTDARKLMDMQALYPSYWRFVRADAWTFAEQAAERGDSWDAVSVDTYTGDATDRSLQTLGLWCAIANQVVTATITTDVTPGPAPTGWRVSGVHPRSDRASWLVLTRG